MAVDKPESIAKDSFKSAKWDEVTRGRDFPESAVPSLVLLCQWYAVIERCMDDLDFGGELPQVAYQNDMGDLKAMPQLSTMKQASAEIRALNRQLGIDDAVPSGKRAEVTPLEVIRCRYKGRKPGAADSRGA